MLAIALLGCDSSKSSARPNTPAAGGAAGAAGSAPVGGQAQAAAGMPPVVVDEPMGDPYPRSYADPKLTKQLVTGELYLLGTGMSACTNELPAPGDRWCAFARENASGETELWVINVSRALQGSAIQCDETSQHCLRLSAKLWTGTQLWGPSHPYSHRFDGDTLLFYADAPADLREPYEGPIYAWRPGWAAARRITERGVSCTGQRLSTAVYCIDALDGVFDSDLFAPPEWHSFDLLAGKLDDAAESPLPVVERIALANGDSQAFRAQILRDGERLAFSSVLAGGTQETLRWVALDAETPPAPAVVIEDAAQWEMAHDGNVAYVLRGYSPETRLGQLALVDFPSGENVRPVATDVLHIDLVGAFDSLLGRTDLGLGYDRATPEGEAFDFIADRAQPEAVQTVAVNIEGQRVSSDGVHTLFHQIAGDGWPVATVARSDGSGKCTLNTALTAETYGSRFTTDGKRVLWVEYGRSGSEEGWSADPATCQSKVKFGDWVLGYSLSRDFVIFEGGDEADSTSYLQYAKLPTDPTVTAVTPLVLHEGPRYPFLALEEGQSTFIVHARSGDTPEEQGLFVHGPLEDSAPLP